MLTVYVYYNLTRSMEGLHNNDVLQQVGSQTFAKSTISDEEICSQIFAGCSSGSAQEYPWFTANTNLRSMNSGDVVTIVRGGTEATSYLCAPIGWTKLPVPVTRSGQYSDPMAPPRLWKDNQGFLREGERALNGYNKITVAINALIAMSDKDFRVLSPGMFPDLTSTLKEYLDTMIKEQVCSSTPVLLTSVLRNSRDCLVTAATARDEDLFLEALSQSRALLNKVLDFTRKRLAESTQPDHEPIPA